MHTSESQSKTSRAKMQRELGQVLHRVKLKSSGRLGEVISAVTV